MTRKIELQEMIQEVSQLQQDKEKGENLIFSPVIGAAAQAEIFKECESLHGSGEGDPRANLDRGVLMNELAKEAQHQTDLSGLFGGGGSLNNENELSDLEEHLDALFQATRDMSIDDDNVFCGMFRDSSEGTPGSAELSLAKNIKNDLLGQSDKENKKPTVATTEIQACAEDTSSAKNDTITADKTKAAKDESSSTSHENDDSSKSSEPAPKKVVHKSWTKKPHVKSIHKSWTKNLGKSSSNLNSNANVFTPNSSKFKTEFQGGKMAEDFSDWNLLYGTSQPLQENFAHVPDFGFLEMDEYDTRAKRTALLWSTSPEKSDTLSSDSLAQSISNPSSQSPTPPSRLRAEARNAPSVQTPPPPPAG